MASSILFDCSSCATSRLLPLRRALHPPPPRFRPSPGPAQRPLLAWPRSPPLPPPSRKRLCGPCVLISREGTEQKQ
ncbi:hypothetical protein ZWY2020_048229 [Hordeum vulgare]|nr:hypothetical protein ZWY2020_048229 [Hordeum vulgare]